MGALCLKQSFILSMNDTFIIAFLITFAGVLIGLMASEPKQSKHKKAKSVSID
jgi:hypothetical protein